MRLAFCLGERAFTNPPIGQALAGSWKILSVRFMAKTLKPDFEGALAELQALGVHKELPEALDVFSQTGLPLLVCEIDDAATVATGDLVFSYKVADQLKVLLAAVRAGKLDTEDGGVHERSPSTSSIYEVGSVPSGI